MSKEQKVGLFFLFGVLTAAVAVETLVGTGLLEDRYDLFVNYPDVEGLQAGDPVRLAGVKVGKVQAITIEPRYVKVRMQLDTDAQVRSDSVARLQFQALSGSRYIAISIGSPEQPILRNGDTVNGEATATLTDMLSQLDDVGKSVTDLAESLNRNQDELLRNVNTLVTENQDSVRALLASLSSVSEKIDKGEGTLAKLINDPHVYNEFEALLANSTAMMSDLRRVSSRLAQGEGTLGRLVAEDDVYDDLQEVLASLADTTRNLQELSGNIRDGQGTLGRLVTDDSLYLEAQHAVRGLDRAASGIEDQAPISVLATFVSTLF